MYLVDNLTLNLKYHGAGRLFRDGRKRCKRIITFSCEPSFQLSE